MSARLAVQLPTHQLPELQRAARALLRRPLLTTRHGDEFRLVLKWETILRNEFGNKLGYRLDVSRSAARLLRRPASLTCERGARLATGTTLTRWGYVYLCLTLAALEQPGQQVLASELTDRIGQLTRGDHRLSLDWTDYVQRRAFRNAVRYLEELGVLTVRDGDVDLLLSNGQVLWDIDRDAAALCMVAAPSVLRSVSSVHDFIDVAVPVHSEGRRRRARQMLNRRIIDQPVVYFDDLTADEAELAWRNRRREAENLARLTGCEVELRREGIALLDDASTPLGNTQFPGNNAIAHAALLWLTELLAVAEPPAEQHDDGEGAAPSEGDAPASRRTIPVDIADECWAAVLSEHGDRLGKDAREQPEAFRRNVWALLRRFRLAESAPSGVAVTALASRYRAVPNVVDADDAATFDQTGLF